MSSRSRESHPSRAASVFRSKRDGWLVACLWLSVLGMGAGAVVVWGAPLPVAVRTWLSGLLAFGSGFIVWLLYSTRYELRERQLVVRAGPFRWTVALDAIEEIFPTRNPLASPACSLDRLRIRYRGSSFGIMISPEQQAEFLSEVIAREPGLRRLNGRLWRTPALPTRGGAGAAR